MFFFMLLYIFYLSSNILCFPKQTTDLLLLHNPLCPMFLMFAILYILYYVLCHMFPIMLLFTMTL
jgi:hypothetical protein